MGYHPEFAQEFEWFNFRETPQSLQTRVLQTWDTSPPGMIGYSHIAHIWKNSGFITTFFNFLMQFNIPLEGLPTETGPGVYEPHFGPTM